MNLNQKELVALGKFWKNYREKAGITQEELARKIGYKSAPFISNFECGSSPVPSKKIPQLIETLKIHPRKVEIFYERIFKKAIHEVVSSKNEVT